MRRRILIGIAACFYYSGLVALARWLRRCSGQRLIILNYHRASGGNLRRHLLYLRHHYQLVHVEAGLEDLYAPSQAEAHPGMRCTPLALTFDDGYRDNYSYGYALACELQVPFAIYLIPDYVESGNYFWWQEGKRMVRRAQVHQASFKGRSYSLENGEDRIALARLIDTRARYAASVAEREAFLTSTRETLAVPSQVLDEEKPSIPLTWEQIREMEASGWVSFGAHTMHHPILATLSDPSEIEYEVAECRNVLERQLGHPVRSFAYPVGQMQHLNNEICRTVQKAGYTWAVTTRYGVNTPSSDRYLLRRVEVDIDQHWLVMAAEAAGLWGLFARLRWFPLIRKYFTNSSK